jgi:scyllo-inositol 2-dehydrogenase (NADP+)
MSKSPTSNPIKTALIGFGASGRHLHLPLLSANKHYQLVAVSTHRSNLSNTLPQGCSQRYFTQVVTDPTIELVVIATPNNSHFELAKKALESRKHVVVEKPMALQRDQVETLLTLAKQQNRLITSFHNRLWDCDFMAIKRLLTSNQLGNVHSYAARVDRYQPDVIHNWRDNPDSGRAVWELAPNLIVQTLTLFGMPTSVFADITT